MKKFIEKIVYYLVFAYYYCIVGTKLWYNRKMKKRRLRKAIEEADFKRETEKIQYYVMPHGKFNYKVWNREGRKRFNKRQKRKGKKQFTDLEFSQLAVYKTKEGTL